MVLKTRTGKLPDEAGGPMLIVLRGEEVHVNRMVISTYPKRISCQPPLKAVS
jgi:hypothetical protein